uniref:RING-type domain-containing protein n=1 Tax=Globodera rostochiensis TaxID=31243 RepID=A0A914IF52_GLORO
MFHVVKVIPPGKYRVIIWDHLITRNDLSVGSAVEEAFPCDIDEIFERRSNPINESSNFEDFCAASQIYFKKNWEPVDSLCRFYKSQCMINYFGSTDRWKISLNNILNQWLSHPLNWEISDKDNFFLLGSFRCLIDVAKKNESHGTRMSSRDAELLSIFLNFLAESNRKQWLWKGLRLADNRIVPMISEFCQIECQLMINIDDKLNNLMACVKFCSQWQDVRDEASKLVQPTVIIETFRRWIYLSSPISLDEQQILYYWIELFAVRTANIDDHWWKWSPFEMDVFREIGNLFVDAKEVFALTFDKIKRFGGIKELLNMICENIKDFSQPNTVYRTTQPFTEQWRSSNCFYGKFRYVPPRHRTSDNLSSMKCVICMTGKRYFAFDPCGHLCVCEECANVVENSAEPNCPICRRRIIKKLRIFHP